MTGYERDFLVAAKRIADALERIANYLETRQQSPQKPSPQYTTPPVYDPHRCQICGGYHGDGM